MAITEINTQLQAIVADADLSFVEIEASGISGRCQVERYYDVALVPKCEVVFGNWPSVQAIGMTISLCRRGDEVTEEVRYDILSEYLTGANNLSWLRPLWFGTRLDGNSVQK